VQYSDLKIAATMAPDRKVEWEKYMKNVVQVGRKVAETNDEVPDLRGVAEIGAQQMSLMTVAALRSLGGTDLAERLSERVISISPPKMPQGVGLNVFGDSGMNLYEKTADESIKIKNDYLVETLTDALGLAPGLVTYKPHHGANLERFVTWAKASQSLNPDKTVFVAGLFLNDYVRKDGEINWEAYETMKDPQSPFGRFMAEMSKLKYKALIIGADSRTWGTSDQYDLVVQTAILIARKSGIPTVSGSKCWARLSMIDEKTRKGKVVKWHALHSTAAVTVLTDFLASIYEWGLVYNLGDQHFEDGLLSYCPKRTRTDDDITYKASPFGINPVLIPRDDRNVQVPASTSSSSNAVQPKAMPATRSDDQVAELTLEEQAKARATPNN
jgi:hypothetical protein